MRVQRDAQTELLSVGNNHRNLVRVARRSVSISKRFIRGAISIEIVCPLGCAKLAYQCERCRCNLVNGFGAERSFCWALGMPKSANILCASARCFPRCFMR